LRKQGDKDIREKKMLNYTKKEPKDKSEIKEIVDKDMTEKSETIEIIEIENIIKNEIKVGKGQTKNKEKEIDKKKNKERDKSKDKKKERDN
jgi:hypothetical protein